MDYLITAIMIAITVLVYRENKKYGKALLVIWVLLAVGGLLTYGG